MEDAMNAYRTNYVQYKLTGDSSYKIAYENAQKWIERYIQSQQAMLDSNKSYIDKFVVEYSNTNPELSKLQRDMKRIQTQGPELQDKYQTNHRIMGHSKEVDTTPYYIKGGVIAGVVGILAVLSLM
jgi:hypothetical protein